MREKIFYSIRTVRAKNTKEAIEKVVSEDFAEDLEICDRVLMKGELLSSLLFGTTHYNYNG